MDRIDIQVGVEAVPLKELQTARRCRSSAEIRANVMRARAVQAARYRGMPGVLTNADARSRDLPQLCGLDGTTGKLLENLAEALKLSARAYDRILKVSRTIADLAGHDKVEPCDIEEAALLRQLDIEQEGDFAGASLFNPK